jgi:hypothetical protein
LGYLPAGAFMLGFLALDFTKKVFEECQLIVGGEEIDGLFVEEY